MNFLSTFEPAPVKTAITPELQKIVGIIMAYNCASLVGRAIQNIPKECFDDIICVDDGSTDHTVAVAKQLGIPVFTHEHMGYGGNLFFGFRKALERGGTHMIELHGDGQYDFTAVPAALERLNAGCDLILGNRYYRMLQPLRDGMDLARYLGNIFLSSIGRVGLGIPTRDLFPGFRAYSRKFVDSIEQAHLSQNYFFSFEIIALSRFCDLKICQIPVRCDYKGAHTSMKLTKGIPLILHTFRTLWHYRMARMNFRRGIFVSLPSTRETRT